ncbi:MAG TPA: Kdo hydroxylase family protein [Blastocatellia bacterium]|nr:Kdo hydroxylase family protein [Blastocatellia bacterium]
MTESDGGVSVTRESDAQLPEGKPWIAVDDYAWPEGWSEPGSAEVRARRYCGQLERGEILFFDGIPFSFSEIHREFLLGQRQSGSRYHKNISYRPSKDEVRGFSSAGVEEQRMLQAVFRAYSLEVTRFLSRFLVPYAGHCKKELASFRPLEEEGRDLSHNKRNDLLHVDAFPTRPTRGARILRVFTNIGRTNPRVWNTGVPFGEVAARFAGEAGLDKIASSDSGWLSGMFAGIEAMAGPSIANLVGTAIPAIKRSAYDRFMLRFHDFLKGNAAFQANSNIKHIEFPPGSTWIVYTDAVPHAVLSGRFALEQTYIVPVDALVEPEKSPIRTLERLCGRSLA